MMRRRTVFAVAGTVAVLVSTVSAATYSTNTVEGLVWLLRTKNGDGNVIELAPGDYHLRDDLTWYTNSSIFTSHLYVYGGARIRGTGERPEDTRLIGSGNLRVVNLSSSYIENLTVTNGCAKSHKEGDLYGNSDRGGGVYGGTATNCLIIGNSAAAYGGGAGNVTFYDCRLIGNTSKYGGAFHNSSAYGCRIEGNRAVDNGGGVFTAPILKDCEIVNNAITGTDGSGGGAWMCTLATNCLFTGNVAMRNGGAIADNSVRGYQCIDCVISNNTVVGGKDTFGGGGVHSMTVRSCLIAGNTSPKYGGGATMCELYDTVVCGNSAVEGGGVHTCTNFSCIVSNNVASSSGGGGYKGEFYDSQIVFNSSTGDGGGVSYSSMVSNCLVYANVCSNLSINAYGSGLMSCTAYDSEICGNRTFDCIGTDGKTKMGAAGGAQNSNLYRCRIHNNLSDTYGGGIRESRAYNCVISNNVSFGNGPNVYASQLVDCEVVGTSVNNGSALRTVFHDIGGNVALVGNPHSTTNLDVTYLWCYYPCATNCLFYGNTVSGSLFSGMVKSTLGAELVNCTVVSNTAKYMFGRYSLEAYPMHVVNCLFYGNLHTTGVARDLSIDNCKAIGLRFSKSAYGVSSILDFAGYVADEVYKFGAADGVATVVGGSPRVCGPETDPLHPYALKHASGVRGRGVVQPWMEGATDIRGDGYARLRDDKVDIGCYQCWLDPVGMMLLFR